MARAIILAIGAIGLLAAGPAQAQSCDQIADAAIAQCNIDFDPSVCLGDDRCISDTTTDRRNCQTAVEAERTQCLANCEIDPATCPAPIVAVPSSNEWALMLLALSMAGFAALAYRRRAGRVQPE